MPERQKTTTKHMSSHIPYEKLADLAERRLPSEEEKLTREHVTDCLDCDSQFRELERVVRLMCSDKAEDAPRDTLNFALSLYRSRADRPKQSLVTRILAALTFDSAEMTPAFGVRSGTQTEARQLLFHAGDTDLDIRVTPSDERWIVSGQLLGDENIGEGSIELEGETAQVSSHLNDLSEFTLPPVPDGSYTLRLRLTNTEIEVPRFNLGA
jgi:hypothetical protein